MLKKLPRSSEKIENEKRQQSLRKCMPNLLLENHTLCSKSLHNPSPSRTDISKMNPLCRSMGLYSPPTAPFPGCDDNLTIDLFSLDPWSENYSVCNIA